MKLPYLLFLSTLALSGNAQFLQPATPDKIYGDLFIDVQMQKVFQDGKTVFKYAVSGMADVSEKIMERNNLTKDDVNWLIAHQANKRIIDATANRMGVDEEKVLVNIQKYGNTTSATLPLLLSDFEDKFKKGDNLIFAAFGGGFTWGSIYLKWAYNKQ